VFAEGSNSVVYVGTPRESLSFLKNQDLARPDGYNGADHWMDLLVRDDSGMDGSCGASTHTNTANVKSQQHS
jgi:hypothetical protein